MMSFWGILARGRQGEGELEGRDQGGSYRYVDRMHPFCRVLIESPRKNSDDTLKTDKISKLSETSHHPFYRRASSRCWS